MIVVPTAQIYAEDEFRATVASGLELFETEINGGWKRLM